MKLRTLTGTRYPATCACGCKSQIPANPEVKVTVDFDTSRPRLTYIPSHAPDAGTWKGNGGNGSATQPGPANGGSGLVRESCGTLRTSPPEGPVPQSSGLSPESQVPRNGHATGFTLASALPAPPPKAPEPPAQPYGPAPTPLALLGSAGVAEPSPSAQANTAWATSQLTFSAAAYESCKAGYADYGRPGETPEALRARVHAVVLQDVEWQARALRDLHARLSDPSGGIGRVLPKDGPCPPPFGGNGGAVSTSPATSSPAPRAGAPSGSASPPRMITPSALPTHPAASRALDGSSLGTQAPILRSPPQDGGPSAPTAEGAGARPSPQGAPVGSGLSGAPTQTSPDGRPLKDLVHHVRLELSDASPLRLSRKEKVWVDWLAKRGYSSLQDVRVGDEWGLGKVLDEFETIDRRG